MILNDIFTSEFNTACVSRITSYGTDMGLPLTETSANFCLNLIKWKLHELLPLKLLYCQTLDWYQDTFLGEMDNVATEFITEVVTWNNRGKHVVASDITKFNKFCSSVTRSSTSPFNTDDNNNPTWSNQIQTDRNYLLLEVSNLKWARFNSLNKLYNSIACMVRTFYS